MYTYPVCSSNRPGSEFLRRKTSCSRIVLLESAIERDHTVTQFCAELDRGGLSGYTYTWGIVLPSTITGIDLVEITEGGTDWRGRNNVRLVNDTVSYCHPVAIQGGYIERGVSTTLASSIRTYRKHSYSGPRAIFPAVAPTTIAV